jgi:hypothetical protein
MNCPQVSIAQEAVKAFLFRFNDKAVFKDAEITCPNVFKSPVISKYITRIDDVDKITGYGDLTVLLRLIYLEFIRGTPEKKDVHVFQHITEVYNSIREMVVGEKF